MMREMNQEEGRSFQIQISECKALSQRDARVSQAQQGGLCGWNAAGKGVEDEMRSRARANSSKVLPFRPWKECKFYSSCEEAIGSQRTHQGMSLSDLFFRGMALIFVRRIDISGAEMEGD